MRVTRVISKEVHRCGDCPYFTFHPYEPSCKKMEELSDKYVEYKGYGSLVPFHSISKSCPFKLKRA